VGSWLFVWFPLTQDLTVNALLIVAGFVCFICWAVLSLLWAGRTLLVLAQSALVFFWGGFAMTTLLGRIATQAFPKAEVFLLIIAYGAILAMVVVMIVTAWRACRRGPIERMQVRDEEPEGAGKTG
jgi:hypothetical protein